MGIFKKKRKIQIVNFDVHDKKDKKNTNSKILMLCLVFGTVLFTWGVISITTSDNFITKSTKKILAQSGIYFKPNNQVVVESNNKNNSWSLTKEANWNSSTTAKVKYELSSTAQIKQKKEDIIIVVNTSESMQGTKLEKVKDSIKDLIDITLENDNRVAITSYNSNYTLISPFTNNKEEIKEKLNNLSSGENTSYYAGLKSVYDVMKDYTIRSNRELITIFITDGYPNVSTPNEKNVYKALKEKYPNMKIYGIQYEMNLSKVIKELKNVSDDQWIANESNISNVLKETIDLSNNYKDFVITDLINTKYFKIKDEESIITSIGTAKIENDNDKQQLVWNLDDKYATGAKQTLEFEVVLKDEYQDQDGLYPIIKNEDVTYSYENETVNSTNYETPVLNTKYEVSYDVNTPKGCSIGKYDKEKYSVFQNVTLKNDDLSCDGYVFKGWEILDDNISNINDEVFVMPGHDVVIRALWATPKLKLSIDGQIYQSSKIYKVLEDANKNKTYAKKYTGEHKDTYDDSLALKDIYYFNAENEDDLLNIKEKNNVLFANHCWQMIRTTDDGGVKLLYNGEPNENNECLAEKRNHIEIKEIKDNIAINKDWYYGDNYEYDNETNKFKLVDNISNIDINNIIGVQGKYTCALTNENEACSTLYYIQSINSLENTTVVSLVINDKYNQIASFAYNNNSNSPSYLGYKYGDVYKQSETKIIAKQDIAEKNQVLQSINIKNKQFLYSDSINYSSEYTLVEPKLVTKYDDSELSGKYTTFKSENQKTASIYQIIGIDNDTAYYVELNNGIDSYKKLSPIIIGDLNDNNTITQTTIDARDWFENYKKYINKYTCYTDTSCTNPKYIVDATKSSIKDINVNTKILVAKNRDGLNLLDYKVVSLYDINKDNASLLDEGYKYTCNNLQTTCQENELRLITSYSSLDYTYVTNHYFGTNIEWDGTKYKLTNAVDVENYNNSTVLDSHHYICIESGYKECNTVGYIYNIDDNNTIYYLLLENGVVNIETALNNMFQKNTSDSTAKRVVDTWYELNLLKYSQYIDEDTVYCNNRKYLDNTGWNNNSTPFKNTLKFKANESNENSLACSEITDQFSYKNDYAKLTYPIALATAQELILDGTSKENIEDEYWTMTPNEFDYTSSYIRTFGTNAATATSKVNQPLAIRPVITLKYGTEFDDGDGSTTSPYHINIGEE